MNIHIVFDLDGTLTDTQKIHQKIESDFLKTKGININPETIGIMYIGRTPKERIPELLSAEKIDYTQEEVEIFVDGKDNIILSLLHAGKIDLMPHAFETLIYLHNQGYKLGLSSGSSRELIDEIIQYFGLEKIVIASTSANEVERKKPYPDVFLSSFSKIEKQYGAPDDKYVIGDGWSDMEGGHKAGAKTIWLNYLKKEKLNDIYCDIEIESLKDLQTIL
ncbi:MAG: HAD family phosphatase [Candidatus Absconditabacterales bacterium]